MPRPVDLASLFHHRWSVPALAELYLAKGAKLVFLEHRLGAPRPSIKAALRALITLGLAMHNPGHGHPLRPEYLLTARGLRLAPACVSLRTAVAGVGLARVAFNKWSMPVLDALGGGGGGGGGDAVRYSELREVIQGVSDRALTLALKQLVGAGLASRLVLDSFPPTVLYQPTRSAAPIIAALGAMRLGFPRPPAREPAPGAAARVRRAAG